MNNYGIGPIEVKGCRTSEMLLSPSPPDQVIELIETDRKIMAQHPGLHIKLLPLYLESESAPVMTGGAYLFDTYDNAVSFDNWLMKDLVVDGVKYTEREILLDMSSQVWHVAGAYNLKDFYSKQSIMRVEEWNIPVPCTSDQLAREWQTLIDTAVRADYSAVWLMHDDKHEKISVITTFESGMCPKKTEGANIFSQLNLIPRISENLELVAEAKKTFDRTSYVFNVWFPITGSSKDQEPLWPNKFLLPAA